MTIDLDRIANLAEMATQGPLELNRYDHGGGRLYHDAKRQLVADFFNEEDREFYAALSPDVVLRLVAVCRAAIRLNDSYDFTDNNDIGDEIVALDDSLAALEKP